MFYKFAWIGLTILGIFGVIYLGTVGITIAKRSVQIEIPNKKFAQ